MLYHDLLDCDPQTNSLRYKRVTCGKNYSARDDGALSSNTLDFYTRVAPLGLGFFRNSGFLYTCGISIAVTIRSIDPRWG